MWNCQGSLFLALEFPRDLTQFYGISRGWALFSLEFPGVKKRKIPGGVFKIYVSKYNLFAKKIKYFWELGYSKKNKKNRRDGWGGYGISKGIKEIACGISMG